MSEDFWSLVDRGETAACWPWLGERNGKGYGVLYGGGRRRSAHRVAYELLAGPIPDGLQIDHLCRNRACCNPVHMEPVTPRENTIRGTGPTAVNAIKTHCVHGHEFTPKNTAIRYRSDGRSERRCRTCSALKSRRRYALDPRGWNAKLTTRRRLLRAEKAA